MPPRRFRTVSGPSLEALALERTPSLPYEFPLRRHARMSGDGQDYIWRLMHFAFALPDPHRVPPLPEALYSHALRDFCALAIEVAGSRALAEGASMHIHQRDTDSELEVRYSLPDKELIRGLSVAFRQLYSPREPSSFPRLQSKLRKAAAAAEDDHAGERLDALAAWGKVQSRLRRYRLVHTVQAMLSQKTPDQYEMSNYDRPSPTESISIYFNGEYLHRDADKAAQISGWDEKVFDGPHQRMLYLKAVQGLSFLYMGYAVLAARVSGHPELLEQ